MSGSLKCPVCGHGGIAVKHDRGTCTLCNLTDNIAHFPRTPSEQQPNLDLLIHMPPQDVLDAVQLVQNYFALRGHTKWAFDGIQSRATTDELPSATLPKIKALAAAFRHEVIPCVDSDRLVAIATAIADGRGPGWGFLDEDERLEIVATVKFAIDAVTGH